MVTVPNSPTPKVPDSDEDGAESPDTAILEGALSVAAALRSGSRPFQSILIRDGRTGAEAQRVAAMASERGIAVRRVAADEIDRLAAGGSHGGVIAIVGPRQFVPMDSLLPTGRSPWIVMIDGVEDPFNFGAAVRCLYAAGADGLVLRPRNWMSAAATVARSSAGATEMIPTAVAETAQDAATAMRAAGLAVACAADDRRAVPLYDADLTRPLFLLIGGEKRGITRSFMDQADLLLRIPYGRPVPYALGTASAAAVVAFEIMRQRQAGLRAR
jgi:23S rRNA (guanosine2251-2'-O)-methyltransferase